VSWLRFIDAVSERTGQLVSWLLIPMTLVLVYAVALRYIFNNPPEWGSEMGMFMCAALGLFAGAYTHLNRGHIKVDIILMRLSTRKKALAEIITTILFFFPFVGLVIWFGFTGTIRSIGFQEVSSSMWAPVLWPIKLMIPTAGCLLFLQGTAKLIRDFYTLLRGGDYHKIA